MSNTAPCAPNISEAIRNMHRGDVTQTMLREWADEIDRLSALALAFSTALAPARPEGEGLKLLGYANAFRIKQTCADKPGGAHLGQVAIYAGASVDPMEIQERENPTWMGEPMTGRKS